MATNSQLIACVVLFIVVTQNAGSVQGARILGVFTSPSKSHLILGTALLKCLAESGHEVTMISAYPLSKPMKNYRDIVMENPKQFLLNFMAEPNPSNDTSIVGSRNNNIVKSLTKFQDFGLALTEFGLKDPTVTKFLHSGEKFDLIILGVFMNEAFFALSHHYQAPIIVFSTLGVNPWVNSLVGNPSPWSYIPFVILGFSDYMTFFQRTINTLVCFGMEMLTNFYYIPGQNKLVQKYFKGAPDLDTLMTNTSLVLLNSHVSLSMPRPHMPSMIEIGGFHVQPPKKLPEDLQKYMDEAKHGVVYFSMGSNVQSKDIPAEIRTEILKVFSELKQKVLWKWEDDNLPGKPDNVKIGKWLPQQDILAHPNVKVFMTHGGLLSTTEAIMRAVPVIGIPIMADQKLNMGQAVTLGYGIYLDLDNITYTSLSWALNEMLNNPKYKEVIKARSAVLNDQETEPIDRAAYWVDYVLRHKGAKHLKSAATSLAWYQYFLLDVIAFITLILVTVLAIIYFSIKMVVKFIRRKLFTKTKTD